MCLCRRVTNTCEASCTNCRCCKVDRYTEELGGFSYGSERGQIRMPSDHNHIVPLYSYGVGTFDFDMGKVAPMEKLAQEEAENHINDFFSN